MARQVLILEELLALMDQAKIPPAGIARVREAAELLIAYKAERAIGDDVTVASGFGQHSRRGFVELTVNDQRVQMEAAKAREIGMMLLESAEAAISDEIFVRLLVEQIGLPAEAAGRTLIELRELRQGTRGTSRPS
jgi:hypothetical protein